ncbi:hypothetical protein BCT69_07970 [Enterovibrio norvegicus]|nr:hypothetical protein BCT69_07970 [Enterovibrio norvegicus]
MPPDFDDTPRYDENRDGDNANDGNVLMRIKDDELAVKYAKAWLTDIGEADATVKSGNCAFCHTTADLPQYDEALNQKGHTIYKLEGCPE